MSDGRQLHLFSDAIRSGCVDLGESSERPDVLSAWHDRLELDTTVGAAMRAEPVVVGYMGLPNWSVACVLGYVSRRLEKGTRSPTHGRHDRKPSASLGPRRGVGDAGAARAVVAATAARRITLLAVVRCARAKHAAEDGADDDQEDDGADDPRPDAATRASRLALRAQCSRVSVHTLQKRSPSFSESTPSSRAQGWQHAPEGTTFRRTRCHSPARALHQVPAGCVSRNTRVCITKRARGGGGVA